MAAFTDSVAELLPLLEESPLDLSRLTDAFARRPELAAVLPATADPAAAIVLLGAARLRARLLAVSAPRPAANAARQ